MQVFKNALASSGSFPKLLSDLMPRVKIGATRWLPVDQTLDVGTGDWGVMTDRSRD